MTKANKIKAIIHAIVEIMTSSLLKCVWGKSLRKVWIGKKMKNEKKKLKIKKCNLSNKIAYSKFRRG